MLYVFQMKPFKQKNFEKPQVFCPFFHKKVFMFQWKHLKIKFSLVFCFASFDSLKAITGCLEKFEISAKRFDLENDLNQSCSKTRMLHLSLLFKYIDVKPILD